MQGMGTHFFIAKWQLYIMGDKCIATHEKAEESRVINHIINALII